MKRFFFHIDLGGYDRDDEGTEFNDLASARASAACLLGELLRDKGDAFWAKPDATVTVTDAEGVVLWKIEAVGTEAAAVAGMQVSGGKC
jgi:hypothetical protein